MISESNEDNLPSDVLEAALNSISGLIPKKSTKQYEHAYKDIMHLYEENKMRPNPSLYAWIVYIIRNASTISKYHPLTKQVFRSSKKIEEERFRHTTSPFWLILHPFSIIVFIWQECFMTLIYLTVIFIDFYICIPMLDRKMQICDSDWYYLYLNMFYLFCSCFNFFKGYRRVRQITNLNIATIAYRSKETEIILKPIKIAQKYIFTFFVIDFASALTYPISMFLARNDTGFKGLVYMFYFVRVFRLFRLITVSQNMNSMILFFNLSINTSRLLLYIFWLSVFIFLLTVNLLAVPTIITHFQNQPQERSPILATLIARYGLEDSQNLSRATIFFMLLIYIGRGLLTDGDVADIFAEHDLQDLVHTFVIICELIIRMVTILVALSLVSSSSVSSYNYMTFRREMQKFLMRSQVEPKLHSQVSTYLESTLRKEYFNEAEILSTLQTHMQYEIFNQTSTNFIRSCPLFYEVPDLIITNLALRLKFETCEEGQRILRVGEIATCMYFIASGTFAVYNKDGIELCHLYDADYFGEIALLDAYSKSVRSADVIALEYSHVFRLHVNDFNEAIKPGTELYSRISRIAHDRGMMKHEEDDDN